MESFFVLEIGGFTQYKYAWFETTSKAQYSSALLCQACNRPISSKRWLEPYEVILKQSRNIGDFLTGAGGCDFITSEKFLNICSDYELKGIDKIYPIIVKKMGTTKKAKEYSLPVLYGVDIKHTRALVDFDKMGVVWGSAPPPDYCRSCGPGGGGRNGNWKRIDRIVVKQETWAGEDMFIAANLAGEVILTSKAAKIIRGSQLTNVSVVPCEEYVISFCG